MKICTYIIILSALLTACSKPKDKEFTPGFGGTYATQGSDMSIFLDVRDAGTASIKFDFPNAKSKYPEGSIELWIAENLAKTLSIDKARWEKDGKNLRIIRILTDDDQTNLAHDFLIQENGDLIFQKDGLRLHKQK